MRVYTFLVCVFLFTLTFFYYLPVLDSRTHGDNINVLEYSFESPFNKKALGSSIYINRFLYSIVLHNLRLYYFKLMFLLIISTTPVFIYLFSKDRIYGFLYGLWLCLFYDKFIYYALYHDSMCLAVSFTFILLYYRNIQAVVLLSLHRIENIALLLLHKKILVFIPMLLAFFILNILISLVMFKCSSRIN